MIYRRSPLQPPRLLLRILATAGSGAIIGASACGGDAAPSFQGSLTMPPEDASDGADARPTVHGSIVMPPEDAGDETDAGGGADASHVILGIIGSVVLPPEGPDASHVILGITGSVILPPDDAGEDTSPILHGSIIMPPEDASAPK